MAAYLSRISQSHESADNGNHAWNRRHGALGRRAPRRRLAGGEGSNPPRPTFFLTRADPSEDLVCAELRSASPVPPEGERRSPSRDLRPRIRSVSAAGRQGVVRQRAAARCERGGRL